MTCFMCKGTRIEVTGTFMAEIDDNIYIIKHVPTRTCELCGHESYDSTTTGQVLSMINEMKNATPQAINILYFDNTEASVSLRIPA